MKTNKKINKLKLNLKSIIALSLILLTFVNTSYAGVNEKVVNTKITDVTVFLSGAQIKRAGSVTLNPGNTSIVIENVSSDVLENSIQAKGNGNFTILSVVYQLDYLKNRVKSTRLITIEDSIKTLTADLDYQKALLEVYKSEEQMLMANKSIGGNNVGVKLIDLKESVDFFRNRLTEISTKQLDVKKKVKKLDDLIAKLNSQLADINVDSDKPTGEIVVNVNTKEKIQAEIFVDYIVNNAGWIPTYDLRAIDNNSPINLNYKAIVTQSTGEDWKDVKLTLCTGNPNASGNKPALIPWYLEFKTNYYNNYKGGYYQKSKSMVQQSQTNNYKEKNQTNVGGGVPNFEVNDYISSYTTTQEGQTNFEFVINIPYNIPSDAKDYTVDIQSYSLKATYEYYCAPKLDKDAFLLAKITDWEEYNLLPGDVNIFYEGTYVGKSLLDIRTTKDTIDISLGRDKNIVVTRTKSKDYTSNSFMGSSKKDTYGWDINVKNNKKFPINIVIEDQFPISSNSEIEVERLELSGGKYFEDSGKIQWKMQLLPGESKKKTKMMFSVKYPKSKTISIL